MSMAPTGSRPAARAAAPVACRHEEVQRDQQLPGKQALHVQAGAQAVLDQAARMAARPSAVPSVRDAPRRGGPRP